jgi:hypothetical protein
MRAQLLQLQEAQASQVAMLLQERTERETARSAAEKAFADQLERIRQAKQYVESLVCSFPSLMEAQAQEQARAVVRRIQETSRVELEQFIRDGQQATEAALEQRITRLGEELRRQLQQMFEERNQGWHAGRTAALQQLQEAEERVNHLTSLVDLELQKHAEEIVAESVAEIRKEIEVAITRLRQQSHAP